jgi:intracellular multiplication protein IcmK
MLRKQLLIGISLLFFVPNLVMAQTSTSNNLPQYMVPVNSTAMQEDPKDFATYKSVQNQSVSTNTVPVPTNTPNANLSIPTGNPVPQKSPDGQGTEAPPTPNDLAYGSALTSLSPMTPQQILDFREYINKTQQAEIAPINGAPKPISRAITLSLQPGEKPPLIHLYTGNATVITFADITGAPWNVTSVTSGSPDDFNAVQAGSKDSTNMVVITTLKPLTVAKNLIVTLQGFPIPVSFSVVAGTDTVDYRLDTTIEARGPEATQDVITGSDLEATNDPVVQNFIDGVPPKSAVSLSTSNSDVQAWTLNDNLYVRTPLSLVSPAYDSKANNVSGISVYTLANTPILLFSKDGKMISVTLTN